MKLYATVTSERAMKGQGGNKFIRAEFSVGSRDNAQNIATINLINDENEFRISAVLHDGRVVPINSIPKGEMKGHLSMDCVDNNCTSCLKEQKGEKQKGENCQECGGGKGHTFSCSKLGK